MKALVGDYPITRLFRARAPLEFADVAVPHTAFKRVVRDLEFDLAELALVTFLLARAHGKPLRLLPAVLTARFQHPYLVSARGLRPRDLEGKRVGERSHTVTTATWVRGILAEDFGVDPARVRWVTFEEPHVAEYRNPPNVERAPEGADMLAMLREGALDAAIVGELPQDADLRPVVPDPEAAARAWRARTGASVQINHMVVVKDTVSDEDAADLYALLRESRAAAGNPPMNPFGIEENRANLEAALDCVWRQGMIPRRYRVPELFR